MSILIKQGRVLDPVDGTDEVRDLLIDDDGRIEKNAKKITQKADRIIEAKGYFVMPGLIDLHEHMRDPGQTEKEDILSGARAAAKGGFTTILAMPNTVPVVDNPDVVNYVHHKAESAIINVLQVGAITKGMHGEELSDIEGMVRAGAPAISEDGKSVMNSGIYQKAMEIARDLDIPVLAHCEDINIVRGGIVNADERMNFFGLPGIMNCVEDVIVARDIMLARDTGCQLHLCHCSTETSVLLMRMGKEHGIRVTAEVTPHHFTLTSKDMDPLDPSYKMNPPLRTERDRAALIEGIKDGTFDVIATDHAPHTFAEKNTSMRRAPFGIVGSETAAALVYSELVLKDILTPLQMAEKMSYRPAQVLHSDRGTLQVGAVADITIFDPKKTWTIDKNAFVSKGRSTPFHGREVTGEVVYTICGGNVAYARDPE